MWAIIWNGDFWHHICVYFFSRTHMRLTPSLNPVLCSFWISELILLYYILKFFIGNNPLRWTISFSRGSYNTDTYIQMHICSKQNKANSNKKTNKINKTKQTATKNKINRTGTNSKWHKQEKVKTKTKNINQEITHHTQTTKHKTHI